MCSQMTIPQMSAKLKIGVRRLEKLLAKYGIKKKKTL